MKKAKHKKSGEYVAIKLIKDVNKSEHFARSVVREVYIHRKLSSIKESIYSCKLLEIIEPPGDDLTHLFLVTELANTDLKTLITDP